MNETITVLSLTDSAYREYSVFQRGTNATSWLIPDFSVAVDEVFDMR